MKIHCRTSGTLVGVILLVATLEATPAIADTVKVEAFVSRGGVGFSVNPR
jgi:hypothetical protein